MEVNPQDIKNLETTEEKNTELEVEEDEPLDEETLKALKNLKVDESVFAEKPAKNVENTENNKNASSKQKKNKKGQDFMEYAKNNGIDLKIQYDEGDKVEKTYQNRKYENTNYQANKGTYENTNHQANKGTYDNTNYQANKGTYQNNNKNFNGKKFYSDNQNTNTEENNTQKPSEDNYYKEKKNFGSYQNNYNKKPYNPQGPKNFHTVNKFDSFNAPQYQNAPNTQTGYSPYPQQVNNTTNTQQPNQSYGKYNQNNQVNQEAEVDMDSFIINSLEYYFSEKNLNNNYYMRVKQDAEGFLNANDLVTFNKMKQNGVTVELIKQTLQSNSLSDNIELRVSSEGELTFRNKNWEEICDKLTPIDVLQQRRNFKKFNNYNNPNPYFNNMKYVGMQNNYFYQMNPQQFDPNMINQQMMAGYGMGMNQGSHPQYSQYPGYDMKMMNYNMYQGAMAGNQVNENPENNN